MTFYTYSSSTSPLLDRQRVISQARASYPPAPIPTFPAWPTITKSGKQVGSIPLTTVLLGEELERREAKLLRALFDNAGLPSNLCAWVYDWEQVRAAGIGYVVSVGGKGVGLWHEYGLVKVGQHHGRVFRHTDSRGGEFAVMPMLHPGTAFQGSFWTKGAKAMMMEDLALWGQVVMGEREVEDRIANQRCGGGKRDGCQRDSQWWVKELDGVGLCEDHYRRRAGYKKKAPKKPAKGSAEAQMEGQEEMFA